MTFLPQSIICDLDGTLALWKNIDVGEGKIVDLRSPYDTECFNDRVNFKVLEVLHRFRNDYSIVFTSARTEAARPSTEKFLKQKCDFQDPILFLRRNKDYRQDAIVKRELYEDHIRPYTDVFFVLDDRDQVVDLWRSLGLTCFQVADGNF